MIIFVVVVFCVIWLRFDLCVSDFDVQPGITEQTRCRLGEAAVKAARAVKYVGAGQ